MISPALPRLYRTLTRELSRLETRALADGPTADELALEADWSDALEPVLATLYLHPFRSGYGDVPRGSAQALREWLQQQYRSAAATLPLLLLLQDYLRRGANLGGQQALDLLGLTGTFRLSDPALLGLLDDHAADLVALGTDLSLVDTTVDDQVRAIRKVLDADADAAVALLGTAIETLAADRSVYRANVIGRSELSRTQAAGQVWTYGRNGVAEVRFRTREDGCEELCKPKNGAVFAVNAIPSSHEIPVHPGCYCIFEPVGYTNVQVPWTGGLV